jgi:hypothetical protein
MSCTPARVFVAFVSSWLLCAGLLATHPFAQGYRHPQIHVSVRRSGVTPIYRCISNLRSTSPYMDSASVRFIGAFRTLDPCFRATSDEFVLPQRVSVLKHAVHIVRHAVTTAHTHSSAIGSRNRAWHDPPLKRRFRILQADPQDSPPGSRAVGIDVERFPVVGDPFGLDLEVFRVDAAMAVHGDRGPHRYLRVAKTRLRGL